MSLLLQVEQAAVAALSQLLPDNQRPLPLSLVRVAASSSDVVPNGGPTWSSTGSEGNCQAVMNAAAKVVKQLMPHVQVRGCVGCLGHCMRLDLGTKTAHRHGTCLRLLSFEYIANLGVYAGLSSSAARVHVMLDTLQ